MNPLLVLGGGAAAVYFLSRAKTFAFEPVKGGVTGKPWLTRTINISGSGDNKKTLVELWSPAGTYGPHQQILVVTYEQTGSDKSTRVSKGVGPEAVPAMVTDAGKDFGIKSLPAPTTSGLIAGVSPDATAPIVHQNKKIGRVDLYHNGRFWQWIAHFNNGRPISQGQSSTPRQAHVNATRTAHRRIASDQRKQRILRGIS